MVKSKISSPRQTLENLRKLTKKFEEEPNAGDQNDMGGTSDNSAGAESDPIITAFKENLAEYQIDDASLVETETGTEIDLLFADGTTASVILSDTEEGAKAYVVIGDEAYEILCPDVSFADKEAIIPNQIPFTEIGDIFAKHVNQDIPSEARKATVVNGRVKAKLEARKKGKLTFEKKSKIKQKVQVFEMKKGKKVESKPSVKKLY